MVNPFKLHEIHFNARDAEMKQIKTICMLAIISRTEKMSYRLKTLEKQKYYMTYFSRETEVRETHYVIVK